MAIEEWVWYEGTTFMFKSAFLQPRPPIVPWASYSSCMRSNVARRDITMPRTVRMVHLRYSWPIRSKRNSLWHPYLCLGFLLKPWYITELKTNGKRVRQRYRYSARCDLPLSVSGGFGPQDNLTVPCWAPTWIKWKENINTCTRKQPGDYEDCIELNLGFFKVWQQGPAKVHVIAIKFLRIL